MMGLQDSLYNWLSIKVVFDARPDDESAKKTFLLFDRMLKEKHNVTQIEVVREKEQYSVSYKIGTASKTVKFPIELIDVMINQMEAEPSKFPNYANQEE